MFFSILNQTTFTRYKSKSFLISLYVFFIKYTKNPKEIKTFLENLKTTTKTNDINQTTMDNLEMEEIISDFLESQKNEENLLNLKNGLQCFLT